MATMIFVSAPGQQDFTCIAGDTFCDPFTITVNGTVLDLSGWKARWSLWPRGSAGGTTPTLALTSTPAAGITLGGVLGTVIVKATPTQTRALALQEYTYQLEFEDAAGDVQTYKTGTFTVQAEIA